MEVLETNSNSVETKERNLTPSKEEENLVSVESGLGFIVSILEEEK